MVPHQATRYGSPRYTLQLGWKKLPIRETVLIKGTDQVLPSLLLFFRISFFNPRLEKRHEFCTTIFGWQGFIQQVQGIRVESEAVALGLLGQALFQVWW